MAIETPLWLQDQKYAARLDRAAIRQLTRKAERVFEGLNVTVSAPASSHVLVQPGEAVVAGDDQPDQGHYFLKITTVQDVDMGAPPPAQARIDLVVARINDPQAGGTGTPVPASVVPVQGTQSATPVAPTPPPTSVVLAQVRRTAGEAAIIATGITDVRPLGQWPYTVSTTTPTGPGIAGDLWVRY